MRAVIAWVLRRNVRRCRGRKERWIIRRVRSRVQGRCDGIASWEHSWRVRRVRSRVQGGRNWKASRKRSRRIRRERRRARRRYTARLAVWIRHIALQTSARIL